MEFALGTMSTKGQIVIPQNMREGIKAGEKIFFAKNNDSIIIKKAKVIEEQLIEDLEFARRTEKALEEHMNEKGSAKTMSMEDFLKEAATW